MSDLAAVEGEPWWSTHPAAFIEEEMDARGWSSLDVARRMAGDPARNQIAIDIYLAVGTRKDKPPTNLRLGNMADDLGRAFDVSPRLFRNLESAWLVAQDPTHD